jgi:hypothetical protein
LEKPEDISDVAKLESNKPFILMIVAISKVDEDIFRDVLRLAIIIYNVPLSIFLLEAIEKVYWSDDIVVLFYYDMRFYSDDMLFHMLYRATKSSLTSTQKMVYAVFMRETANYIGLSRICEFSAQLENIKLLAETEQYAQAKNDYMKLIFGFYSVHNKK